MLEDSPADATTKAARGARPKPPPTPDTVRLVADQLVLAFPHAAEQLGADPGLAASFAAMAAAGHSLSRVIVTDPAALDVLCGVSVGTSLRFAFDPAEASDVEDLVRRKAPLATRGRST